MAVRVASLYADVEVRVSEAERQLAGLRQELDKTEHAAKGNSTRFTELQSALGLAQQAYAGVAQVVQFTANAINEGAQLQVAKAQFDNLTASIGSTSESMLNDLRAATNGMVSDAQLMTSATDIISLGLASTQEDTVRLANAVGTLGLDMQQVILTFANNSKARLDSLGLSIQDVDRITQEYVATGKSADEAFDLAVLDALEDRMELLGSTADTTAGSIAKLTAHQQNLTDKFNEFMAVQWEPILGGLVNTIDAVGESADKGRSPFLNMVIIAEELGATISGRTNPIVQDWIQSQKEAVDVQYEATHATDAQVAGYERLINGYNMAYNSVSTLTQAELDHMMAASEAAFATSELADKVAQSNQHISASEGVVRAANAANREHFKTLQEQARAAEQAAQAEAKITRQTATFFNQLDKDSDLLAEYRDILGDTSEVSVRVAGRTAEQESALKDLQSEYQKMQETITDYQIGVKSAGLSEDERNEKIAETQERMAELQAAMDPLLGIQNEYATVVQGGSINQELLNQKIFEGIQAHTESASAIAIAGEALGIYTEEEAKARLEVALLDEFIRRQIESWDGTRAGVQDAQTAIQGYISELNNIPSEVNTTVTTNFVTTGDPSSAAGGVQSGGDFKGGGQKEGGAGFATGVIDFVVPPGFPNDSFNIGFTSGETVTAIKGGGQSGGNGSGGMTVNGPLIGAVYQQPGEDTNAFASRVTTMITEKIGELN